VQITSALTRKLAAVLVVVLITAVAVPAFASAQQVSPTDRQYRNTLTQVGGGLAQPAESAPAADSGLEQRVGPLPFTGFDVIAMAAVALAVTGLGLGLQRAVSREPGNPLQ
jgi:hypothetical protein